MNVHRCDARVAGFVAALTVAALSMPGASAGAAGLARNLADPDPSSVSETDWVVVPNTETCPPLDSFAQAASFRQLEMTRFDKVCLGVNSGQTLTAGSPLVTSPTATPADSAVDEPPVDVGTAAPTLQRLVVANEFEWGIESLPKMPVSFSIGVTDGDVAPQTVKLDLVPVVDVKISFGAPFEPLPTEAVERTVDATVDTAAPSNGTAETTTTIAASDDTGTDGVTIGQTPRVKKITVVGGDAGIDGLQIREQIRSSQLRAVVNGVEREIADGTNTTVFDLAGSSVSYDLGLTSDANFGSIQTSQQTELVFGDLVLASTSTVLQLDAPSVEIDVQTPREVTGGAETKVTVIAKNLRDTPVSGPLTLVLRTVDGDALISSFGEIGGEGTASDSSVTWTLPGGLQSNEEFVEVVQVDVDQVAARSTIVWRVDAMFENESVAFASDSATTNVLDDAETGTEVPFTPDQLIRLIAFVMAFALVAVIFGAWTRRPGDDPSSQTPDARESDLDRFRAYTQAILVLVILVAILVLALNGSLSGESAGSLIGVIAGYALGNSRGGRGQR